MLLFYSLVEWLERRQLPCFYKSIYGIDCPGCGMQRAFIELLRGNLVNSLKLYPALIPTILMLGFLITHILFNLKFGAKILLSLFILNVVIIVISYLYKIII